MQRTESAITTYRDVEKGKEPGDRNRAATVPLLHVTADGHLHLLAGTACPMTGLAQETRSELTGSH
jgi:hypothetical protein